MQKPIIITVFLSLLLILGIIFIWWPKYQDFDDLRIEVKEKKVELENKEAYFSELENLSLKLEEYSEILSKADSLLPLSLGTPDLLNFFQKESSQNGLVLEKVHLEEISPIEKELNILKVPISISLSGTYSAFKNFLSAIEKSTRLTEVGYVSFTSPLKGDIFSFDLIIKAYSY